MSLQPLLQDDRSVMSRVIIHRCLRMPHGEQFAALLQVGTMIAHDLSRNSRAFRHFFQLSIDDFARRFFDRNDRQKVQILHP